MPLSDCNRITSCSPLRWTGSPPGRHAADLKSASTIPGSHHHDSPPEPRFGSFLSWKVVLPVVLLSAMLGTFAPAAAEVVLLRDGKSACRIVLEETASASEKHAAEELQSYFEASTGVKLPIVVGMPDGDGPMIVVGRGKVAASLGVEPSDEQLGEQGFVLRTVEPHLVIAGTARAGTLHGVRYFLEHVLGVRWYAPDATKTPSHKNLVIEKTDRLIQPGFAWRQTSYAWPGGDAEFRVVSLFSLNSLQYHSGCSYNTNSNTTTTTTHDNKIFKTKQTVTKKSKPKETKPATHIQHTQVKNPIHANASKPLPRTMYSVQHALSRPV